MRSVLSLSVMAAAAGFSTLALAQAASAPAPKSEDKFEFAGYHRLGYNTSLNILEEAPDEQGYGGFGLPTSRHVRSPNYLKFILRRSFENGMKFQAQLDSDGDLFLAHETNFQPQVQTDAQGNATRVNNGFLRIRDAYLSLPLTQDVAIWAGSRLQGFEDLRLLDGHNPFDINAFGAGLEAKHWLATLSYQKATRTRDTRLTGPPATSPRNQANVKDLSLLLRYSLPLDEDQAIKPMLKITHFGSAQEDRADGTRVKEMKGSTEFSVGGTYSRWDGKTYWGNTTVAFISKPAEEMLTLAPGQVSYSNARTITGEKSGTDSAIYVADTTSYDFGVGGVLTGLYLQYNMFKNDHQVFKRQSNRIEADGTKKEKQNLEYSVGVQPIYYVTDNFHTVLDLNYAGRSEKFAADQANVLLVTPMLRYAMNRNPLGTPQIYTSFTYGNYEANVKKDRHNRPTRDLWTTQTGFEVWF